MNDRWTELKRDVLNALNIVAEYEALGLVVRGDDGDWIPCEVFGEADRSPSAQINVSRGKDRGRYNDFRNGLNVSFFDFCVDVAKTHASWRDALEDYAGRAGIPLPAQKHSDGVEICEWNAALMDGWFQKKPPITKEAFFAAGGKMLKVYGDPRIALPVFDAKMDAENPCGWVVWHRLGLNITLKGGADVKMQTLPGSKSGLMGLSALKSLADAEIVWKAEGPGDMLAIESVMPTDLRGRHVAVTNSGGAGERPKDWQIDLFAGKTVYVVADADEAGIKGATRWAEAIATVAAEVRLVTLPYKKTKQKGKDARDFFNEGHSYEELHQLAAAAPTIQGKQPKTKSDLPAIELGDIEPRSGLIVLDPNRTQPTAEAFIKAHYTVDGVRTIHYQNGVFFRWYKNAYRPVERDFLKGQMLRFLTSALTQRVGRAEVYYDPFPAKDGNVTAAISALEGLAFRASDAPVPCWLGENLPPVNPSEIIFGATKNITIHSETELESTPKWFNFNALDFDYDKARSYAPKWDAFMCELFGDDIDSFQTLMEFIGLLLTPITKFQKALFLIGPKRSGKGTIARIIRRLVGTLNCCSPTSDSLMSQFGLQPLIGKTVAIVSDARFHGVNLPILIERLLNITGEDELIIDRKHHTPISVRLQTRFLLISNEVPTLRDSSGAIASRFIMIKLKNSFYGKENLNLENELMKELPEILHLALWSLKRLLERNYFLQPESAREEIELLEDLGSPIGRFVREKCTLGAACWVSSDELWRAWEDWRKEEGITYSKPRAVFFRELNTVVPEVTRIRKSGDNRQFYCF